MTKQDRHDYIMAVTDGTGEMDDRQQSLLEIAELVDPLTKGKPASPKVVSALTNFMSDQNDKMALIMGMLKSTRIHLEQKDMSVEQIIEVLYQFSEHVVAPFEMEADEEVLA